MSMRIAEGACHMLLGFLLCAAMPGGTAYARSDASSLYTGAQHELHDAHAHQPFNHRILHEGRTLLQAASNSTTAPAASNSTVAPAASNSTVAPAAGNNQTSSTNGAVDSTVSTSAPAPPAVVTEVQTASQLLEAVTSGQQHILVTKHLVLQGMPLISPNETSLAGVSSILGVTPVGLQSITGYCLDPPPQLAILPTQAPLRPFIPGQCLLAVDYSLLTVNDANLWLNSLYIRLIEPRNETFYELVYVQGNGPISEGASAAVFMTNVTLQGDGDGVRDCLDCGITADLNSGVYAEDCLFVDFDGSRTAAVYAGGTANFVRCKWESHTLLSPSGDRTAVILADGFDDDGYDNDGDALVRLEGCTFTDITPVPNPYLIADDTGGDPSRSTFWSDQLVSMRTLRPANGTGNSTLGSGADVQSAVTVPGPLSEAPDYFMDRLDPWFMTTLQALQAPTQTVLLPSSNTSSSDPANIPVLPPLAPATNTTAPPVDIAADSPLPAADFPLPAADSPLSAPAGASRNSSSGGVFVEESFSVPQTQTPSAVDPFIANIRTPTPFSSGSGGLQMQGQQAIGRLYVPVLVFVTVLLQVIV